MASLPRLAASTLALLVAASCSTNDETRPAASSGSSGGGGGGGDAGAGDGDGDGGTTPGPDGGPAPGPGFTVTNETMTSSGATRSYTLVVPETYDASKTYPLVLLFHGDGGDGASYHAYYPFEAASGQDAILAYPSGTNAGWDLYTATAQNNEMQFIKELVTKLAGTYSIDTGRVFGDGYSAGGFFVSQMACRVAGVFKGITMHAGGAPAEPNVGNPPTNPNNGCILCAQTGGGPTATLVIHGTADGTVTLDSGEYAATCWSSTNGCPKDFAQSGSGFHEASGCPADKPVGLHVVPGLAHTVWSEGAAKSWGFFAGL